MVRSSRPGSEHARLDRNNQDALALASDGETLVLVVADGCSQGPHSELGALVGARWLARIALQAPPERLLEALHEGLLGHLRLLLASWPGSAEANLAEALLFSWTLAHIGPERARVVGCGDGCWSLDGALRRRDPGPDNAPPYSAYALVEGLETPTPQLLGQRPTSELDCLVLASDGIEDLPQQALAELLEAPSGNPHRLTRLLRRHARVLTDDTSVFLLRRRP
jgi:serine/threonine protein phosphatase PrpC